MHHSLLTFGRGLDLGANPLDVTNAIAYDDE